MLCRVMHSNLSKGPKNGQAGDELARQSKAWVFDSIIKERSKVGSVFVQLKKVK